MNKIRFDGRAHEFFRVYTDTVPLHVHDEPFTAWRWVLRKQTITAENMLSDIEVITLRGVNPKTPPIELRRVPLAEQEALEVMQGINEATEGRPFKTMSIRTLRPEAWATTDAGTKLPVAVAIRDHTPEEALNVPAIDGKAPSGGAGMLTIRQAAEYARVDERTIREWLGRYDGDKPMLPGAIKAGRMIRIPRGDLDPWRKAAKATRTPKTPQRQQTARKAVKRKS